MERKAYIVDVDGTTADLTERLQYFRVDHAKFEAGMRDDLPIWPVIRIVQALHEVGHWILFTSGRSECTRTDTEWWFDHWGVPRDRLYMRKDGDTRPDHIVKREILQQIRDEGFEILGVIDDRQSVVDMWREEGLLCLQAAPTNFDMPKGATPILNLMVGPTGAGKSSFLNSVRASAAYGIHAQHVIASDRVRLDLYGTLHCMDKNERVFEAVRHLTRSRLRHGLPTTIDATNIRNKDRIEAASIAENLCPVRYIVLDRPMADKLRDGGWRLDVKFRDGSNLVHRHDNVFRSNVRAIMAGDGLPHVTVHDERVLEPGRLAAA